MRLAPTALIAAVLALGATSAAAQSFVTGNWNGYRWRSTQITSLRAFNRLTTGWHGFFDQAVRDWNVAPQVEMTPVLGTPSSTCSPLFGTIQVCNGSYGANGWLGSAQVWLSGGFVVQGTVRLNDSYFAQARYNTTAFRQSVMCHEIGHLLGLAHNDEVFSNTNTGSCMDYSSVPQGGGSWGPSNLAPGAPDFRGLASIYGGTVASVPLTQRTILAWSNLVVEGDGPHEGMVALVPEPGQWAMLIAGFGLVGLAMRRRHLSKALIAA